MKKSRIIKSFDRDFKAYENNTICYIHIENLEIPVSLQRERNKLKMQFKHNGILYISKEIINEAHNDYVDPFRIKFEGISLHEIDLNNLRKCIDKMFDELYG